MTSTFGALAVSALVALSTGAARERPLVSLSASPSRLALARSEVAPITLRNFASTRIVVTAATSGVVLDPRGRPKLVARAAPSWLSLAPKRLAIPAAGAAVLRISSRAPSRAEPGDHHAVLLLTTRPLQSGGVGVRMRIGVRVVVRVPGPVIRKLAVVGLRIRRRGRARMLEVALTNRGNVTEALPHGRVTVELVARGRTIARLRAAPRELLPRSRGIVAVTYRGSYHGPALAFVEVRGAGGRRFRIRV